MCVSVGLHTRVPCTPGVTEDAGSPGTTVTDRYKPPVGARSSEFSHILHTVMCTHIPVLRAMTGYH